MHFAHEYLLYGFDVQMNTFLAIGFDKNRHFCKLHIGMKELQEAYANNANLYKSRPDVGWLGKQSIILLECKGYTKE
jgi:hypothetical protein